ncbi:MAG TPA: hypothetical protein PKV15_05640 [Syntrophomonadaceae bacterium]|nr:hypothetical protein [Syntrophomonadaceae bacterium]HRX21135.1 hypothetical protein [Syntrophomonadaceae bacterium]
MRLYSIHFFALIAVALSTYFPGLDIALAVLYIVILGMEAIQSNLPTSKNIIIGSSLQIPGFILAIINLAGIMQWDLSSYALFILQYWYIPLIPLISLISYSTEAGVPLYHYILLGLPVLMSLYYYLTMLAAKRIRQRC